MKKNIQFLALIVMIVISGTQTKAEGYKIGDSVRDFKLKNVDGKMVSMSDYSDAKGFIVVFTCNHCPFSKAYETRIMQLDKKYAPLGFPVIAINPNDVVKSPGDSYENMQELSNEKSYSFPYLYDESQKVATEFGASRTPHVFILQKDEKAAMVKYIGAIDDNADEPENVKVKYVQDALNSIISGKNVEVAETKAIGCTIKWKQ